MGRRARRAATVGNPTSTQVPDIIPPQAVNMADIIPPQEVNMVAPYTPRDDPAYRAVVNDMLSEIHQTTKRNTQLIRSYTSFMDKFEKNSHVRGLIGRGVLRTCRTGWEPEVVGSASPDSGPQAPSPADLVSGPLMEFLQQQLSIDHTPQDLLLRPEYYIQHVDRGVSLEALDHTTLTYKELVSGMGRVMVHLASSGGDLPSYVRHFNFVAKQAASHHFVDAAYVCYDRYVVDQVIQGSTKANPPTFVAGDLRGVASNFHSGNLVPVASPSSNRDRSRGWDDDTDPDKGKDQTRPEGFPEDVCFNWNFRACTRKCKRSHVCPLCRETHTAPLCPYVNTIMKSAFTLCGRER